MSALTDHQFCFLLPGEPYLLNVTVDSLFIFYFHFYIFVLFITKTLSGKKHLSGFWDSVYGGGGGGGGFVREGANIYLIFIYLFIYPPSVYLIFGNFVKYQVTSHQKEILNIKTLIHM